MRIFNSIHSITQNRFRFLSIIFLSALAGTMFASINDVVSSSEAASSGIRFEGRDGYAGALARGVVSIGEPSGASVTSWDSTAFADGWQSVSVGINTAELAVLNNAAIAIEGGRLHSNTTWDASVTHLLRNVVYVPNGVTLTISEGTVVKFCEGTYIKVEDGGKLNVVGAASKDVIFTAANDNSVGQQIIGIGEEKLSFAGIKLQSSAATFTDNNYFQGRGFSFNLFPIVTLNNTTAFAAGGVARIPVTLSGATRDAPFFINWVAETNGVSFASGSLDWTKSSDGTKNIVVNFDETFAEAVDSFTIRIVTNTACSISKETCLVTISEWITLPIERNENQSSSIRFEGRDGYAGALARGVVSIGEPDGASVTSWDSTAFADGWQSVSVGTNTTELAVLNNAAIAIEGGRLHSNTTWDASVTHLLRNVVYVPNGVTLTVSEGTVVKFCEGTYIKVEDGGKLNVVGADGKDVIFTAANDNSAGKPIVGIGEEKLSFAGIKLQSSAATFTDNGYFQGRGFIFSPFPTVTLNDAIAFRASGNALIPVTVAGATRNTPFSIDWVAKNGSAKFGEDYTIASGTITWSKSSEGTKTIQIPLVVDHIVGSNTTFTLSVTTNRCVSVAKESCTVEIRELDMLKIDIGDSESRTIRFDGRDSYAGALARGVVSIGEPSGASVTSWDSIAYADGWQCVSVGTNTAEFAVLNNAAITIEGGRLHSNTTWDSSVTHLLRNIVYVPNGVTLTISEGTVVKFCEGTYIKVEDGGKLNVVGADGKDVIFTAANDNSVGKPIVGVGEEKLSFAGIKLQSSAATFTDNGWVQARGFSFGSYPTVTLHDAIANRLNGKIYVAATISGATRNQSFSIEWEAEADTAKFKEDYTLASGRITWSKSGDGTKWIEIPLNTATVANDRRQFKVLIKIARGVNVGDGEAVAQIDEYENCSFNGDEITTSTSNYGDSTTIDDKGWRQPIFLNDVEPIRYSGLWQSKLPADETIVRISIQSDNGITTLAEYPGEKIGEYNFNVASLEQGYYNLKHEIIDESTGNVVGFMQRNFSIVDKENVVLHGGTLTGNEVWEANKIHVVYQTVVVPSIYTLFIEPGAIVKFMSGTGIDISSGGAFFANNIIFTHINDDTIGGDTLSDGFTVPPTMDSYTLAPIGSFTFGPGSELRYITQPVDLTGTISGNKILLGGSTYRVSGTLTIANGGNLIIPAGTVLKMKSGASIVVNNGGSLNAQGTRVAPIVITSINDDEFGGDTNGDGDRSIPQPGDWNEIRNNGGSIVLTFTSVLYGGFGNNTNTGEAIIRTNSGTTDLNNCVIKHSDLRLIGRSGGTVNAVNCILQDGRWGIDGAITFVNGVIADCNTGANGATVYNSIFWACDTYSSSTKANNCVAYGGSKTVQSGMVHGDPKFVDPDNGDFRIYGVSICVDAADNSVAPELDYYGQPRITLDGVYDEQGIGEDALADIGICELMPRNVTSDIDLVPGSITAPSSVLAGDGLFVKWEVINDGGKLLNASWRDTISLVSSMGQEVVLGDKVTSSQISVGGSVFCSGYFVVPPLEEGEWYPKVNVNSSLDVFEGALGVNNVLIGENPISVSVDTVDTDLTNSGVLGAGLQKVLKLSFTSEDKNRMVKFSMPDGVKVSYGFGFVPNSLYSSGVIVSKDGTAMFLVPEGDMEVYIILESDDTISYEMSIESIALVVSGVYPNVLPSSGTTTITITGAGFGDNCEVMLSIGDENIQLQSIVKDNDGNLVATVDSAELVGGSTYNLIVQSEDRSTEIPHAIFVTQALGKGEIEAKLVFPNTARQGRVYVGYVEYSNIGNADMPAPVFVVSSDSNGLLVGPSDDSSKMSSKVHLIGVGSAIPVGVLRAGDSMRVPFYFVINNIATYGFKLDVLDADSDELRNSIFTSWQDFAEAIADAVTVLNSCSGRQATYEEAYELAMRKGYGSATGVVAGTLVNVNDNRPMVNIELAISDTNNTRVATVVTDKNGCFSVNSLVSGEVYEIMSKMCQVSDVIVASSQNENIIFGAPLGEITCDLDGLKSNEINGVYLLDEDNNVFEMSAEGESLSYKATGLEDGSYTLSVSTSGYNCLVSNVVYDIYAGNITNKPASVTIEKSGHAYVTIYDSKSQTISDFSFALYNETTGFVASSVTDEEGTAFFNVPEGEYGLILTSGYNLRNGVKINILQGQDVSASAIVEEVPFVLTPPMGAIPLSVECFANTNGYQNVTKCLWDFDNDGTWDAEGFAVTNVYNNASFYDVSLKMVSSNGSEQIFTETEAVNAWEKDCVELVDGALVLNKYSGYTVSEVGEDYLILTLNEMYLPLGLQEGMCVINPSDILIPYEIVSFDELDEKTLRLEVKKTALANAYRVLRTSSLNIVDDIFDGFNGSAKGTYGHHLKWSSDDNIAHVDVAIEGTLEFIIDYNKNYGLNFVMCHDSFTVGGIEVGLEINKPLSDKYDFTPNKYKNKYKKYRKKLPIVDKQILVGYLPLRIEGYGFFEFELKGSINFSHSGKNQIEWNSRKGWKRDDVIRTKNINLNGEGTASVGVALDCGIGIGKTIKTKDYGVNILDATVKLGFQGGLEYDWNSNESIPDVFTFNCGEFGAFETKFAHIKWAGFEYYLASAEIEFKKDYYSYSWETPIPDFSVEYDKSLATSCYNYIDVNFASTTVVDNESTAFVSREWLLGNLCFSSEPNISHRFYCNPDDKIWYTVYLYEKYKPTGLISQWIPFQRKAWKKEILVQGHSSDEPIKVKELARDRGGIVPRSSDPNEMVGPLGSGDPDTERFVTPGEWMTYTVYFENKSDATAAAQEVTVSNPLSKYLDWDTLEMLDVAFGNQIDVGLSGKSSGVSEIAMQGSSSLVRTEMTLDKTNGKVNWYLRIVDPTTDTTWPLDPVAGFLPPNDETHRGEGHITYRIKLRDDVPLGTKIDNSATIVFDYNEPIETDPAWWNIVGGNIADKSLEVSFAMNNGELNQDGNYIYDGTPKCPEVSLKLKVGTETKTLVQGSDFECTFFDNINANSETNLPRVAINATGNYFGSVVTNFVIAPRPVSLVSATDTWVYDGKPHNNDTVTADGFIGSDGVVCSNFVSIVDVGAISNKFEYAFKSGVIESNYNIKSNYGTLTVTPANIADMADESKWAVTLDGDNAKYDGTEKTVTVSALSYDGVAIPNYTVTGNKATDAGAYTLTITASGNFDGSKTAKWSIGKRSVTLTSASSTKVYDGTALKAESVTVGGDGFANGEGATYTFTGSQTNVGTSENTFAYRLNANTKAGNYDITTANGALTVITFAATDGSKWAVTLEGDNAKYDGTEKTVTVRALSYDGVAMPNYTVTGNKATDAGTYTLTITANGNFAGSKSVEWSIAKRAVTLTSASETKVYDGTALKAESVTVGGDGFANGEGATYLFTTSQTDIGSCVNDFTYALNQDTKYENYDITTAFGTLTVITPPTVELKIDLSKTVKGKGEWGNVMLLTNSIPLKAAVAGSITSYTINGGANVDLTFVPNEGFRIYGSQAGNGAFTSITNYTFVAMTNCTYSATFQPAPKTSLAWKYAKNKNCWFCAQIALPGYAGYSEAFENPRFLFADRVNSQNVRTLYLVDTSTVIDPLSTTEVYGNTTYRKVALSVSAFNGKVNGARVVFGVSDATMSSTVDSVPAGERTIALRVVNRNINSVELLDNVIGYFVWDCCGETYYQPLGGKQSPGVILRKPLSISTLNNASAFGIDASAVAPEYVNCRFTSFNIANGKFDGTFEVVAESDEGTKVAVKEISSSVDTSLLGSESPAGPFEPIEDEVKDVTFDVDNAPFTFEGTLPKKYKFFRLNLNIEEIYK